MEIVKKRGRVADGCCIILMYLTVVRNDLKVVVQKILETETAGRACLFEALCEGVSTRFGRRALAKYLEKTRPTGCFGFQNLRLGGINFLVATMTRYQPSATHARF